VRLVIIDDHELVCEALSALIMTNTDHGIELVYAGLDVHEAMRVQPEIAILDVELGPGNPTVSENLATLQRGGVKVLLISAFEEAPVIRRALSEGALGFIPKRVTYDQFLEAVNTVAQGELYMSVDLASILANAQEVPGLSPRELDTLRLYASGLKLVAVAHKMGISPHTAKEYLDRVRAKYEAVGRVARTRTELYVEAQRDGFLSGVT
jgi:two-component system nitrate/nitrite response regulator NarL